MTAKRIEFSKNRRGEENNLLRIYLAALLFSVALLVLSSLVFSVFAYLCDDPISLIGICSIGALLLSGIASGIFTARRAGGMGMAMLVALGVVLLMIICAIAFSGGTPSLSAIMNYGIYALTLVLSSYLGRPREKRRHKIRHT